MRNATKWACYSRERLEGGSYKMIFNWSNCVLPRELLGLLLRILQKDPKRLLQNAKVVILCGTQPPRGWAQSWPLPEKIRSVTVVHLKAGSNPSRCQDQINPMHTELLLPILPLAHFAFKKKGRGSIYTEPGCSSCYPFAPTLAVSGSSCFPFAPILAVPALQAWRF